MTHICFVLQSIDASYEKEYALSLYEAAHKVLCKLLYSHPNIVMSMAMNGRMLEYLTNSHAEFLCLLRELLARGQIEVIGGGYYDPAFPLLLPRERTAQIDMLTASITAQTGKKPHTAMLYASSFSDSLVAVLKSNGIDCVLLDSSAISSTARVDAAIKGGIPMVMSDRGKSIDIFPILPLLSAKEIIESAGVDADDNGTVRVFCYTPREMVAALTDGSFLRMSEAVCASGNKKLSTIAGAMAAVRRRVRVYIASGVSHSVCGDAANIQEYLQSHIAGDDLCHRQTFISILIEQYHGDKARKRAAREYLLSSQCGNYLLGGNVSAAYKMLNQAESQIRAPCETVTAMDINEDGEDEYVCRMGCHTSVVSGRGNVVSFDATAGRGLHRYSYQLFDDYLVAHDGGTECFASYCVQKFLRARREVFFLGRAVIDGNAISICKKYIATSNGFMVQYIIKNEGQDAFASRFCVRFCFLCVDDQVKSADLQNNSGGVSAVQLTDSEGGVSFLVEPNEDAALCVSATGDKSAQNVTLSWQISIDGGRECEKTVSLAMLVKGEGDQAVVLHPSEPFESGNAAGQLDLWEQE